MDSTPLGICVKFVAFVIIINGGNNMQKTNNLYIAEVEGDEPVLISAETEIEAISKLASYIHNEFEVFELALKNMNNREQIIELYERFFGDEINLFGIVDKNVYHNRYIEVI